MAFICCRLYVQHFYRTCSLAAHDPSSSLSRRLSTSFQYGIDLGTIPLSNKLQCADLRSFVSLMMLSRTSLPGILPPPPPFLNLISVSSVYKTFPFPVGSSILMSKGLGCGNVWSFVVHQILQANFGRAFPNGFASSGCTLFRMLTNLATPLGRQVDTKKPECNNRKNNIQF